MLNEQMRIINEVMEKFYNSEREYRNFANVQCYHENPNYDTANFCIMRIPMNLVNALDELESKGSEWMPRLGKYIDVLMYSYENDPNDFDVTTYKNSVVDVSSIEDITKGFSYKSDKYGYEWTVDNECNIYKADDVIPKISYYDGKIVVDCICSDVTFTFTFDVKNMQNPEIATETVIKKDVCPN